MDRTCVSKVRYGLRGTELSKSRCGHTRISTYSLSPGWRPGRVKMTCLSSFVHTYSEQVSNMWRGDGLLQFLHLLSLVGNDLVDI